jgi:putative effector of murein hydrolase
VITAPNVPTKTLSLAPNSRVQTRDGESCGSRTATTVLKAYGLLAFGLATTKCETLLVASVTESIAPEVTTGVRSTVELTAQYCTPVPAC